MEFVFPLETRRSRRDLNWICVLLYFGRAIQPILKLADQWNIASDRLVFHLDHNGSKDFLQIFFFIYLLLGIKGNAVTATIMFSADMGCTCSLVDFQASAIRHPLVLFTVMSAALLNRGRDMGLRVSRYHLTITPAVLSQSCITHLLVSHVPVGEKRASTLFYYPQELTTVATCHHLPRKNSRRGWRNSYLIV